MRLTDSAIARNAAPIIFKATRFSARRGLALLCLLTGLGVVGLTSPATASTATDRARVLRAVSTINFRGLPPQVRITSPLDGDFIAPGNSTIGHGDHNGTGFAINVEVVTHDKDSLAVDEDVNIRDVSKLGGVNPHFPGLFVFIDEDLITPDGGIIPANTNLGPLFNIAGTDDTPGPGVTVWAGWHVLESIRPRNGSSFHLTVAVIDSNNRIGSDKVTLFVDPTKTDRFGTSGNGLTQNPGEANRVAGGTAPIVSIVAPREPTAVTFGQAPPNGSLHFIQVSIIDREGDVVVDELGGSDGLLDPANPNLAAQFARIDDGAAGVGNPNRNVPGFDFRFSVPSGAAAGSANSNVARLFNIAGSEVVLLEDGTPAVRTVLNWVVAAPFVGSALLDQFVTFTATVTDANGNQGVATRTFQLTDSAVNGDALTPQPLTLQVP
ncbi:MAG TPA: hypothetical protein VFW45_00350 [Candidatus Polarisedimenticolia bacterium]|nr:hypothetical protein [Candidatus Polarisedimenticolia bacterium]